MKNPFRTTQRILLPSTFVFVLAMQGAHSQTTGFNQTGAGPHNYNDTLNWVGGNINGIWDSSLTLAAAQTATFGADTTLTTGLLFNYTGGQNLTLRSDGVANRTLTLGGNIILETVSADRTITFGSTSANQGLNVDLGGATRTFTVGGLPGSSTRTLTLTNNVINGGLLLNGGGNVNFNGTANTFSSLRIQNAAFRMTGVSAANTATTVSGALTIDGVPTSVASNTAQPGGIATITLTPNGSRNTSLSASSLVRENKGVVFFRGNNLGGTLGANGVSNITFGAGPALIGGGGAAGTKNISILNWAVGATTAGGTANTFVTYDPTNGIRPLDVTTEFENYAADYSGTATGTADSNTRIATGTVTLTGDNTVNSLFLGGVGTATLANGGGTLTVASGAVFLQNGGSTIAQNLNFGTREGIIGYTQGQSTTISGDIAGSGGFTLYQAQANASSFSNGTGINFTAAATFTGDLTVNSRAQISHSDFLANGSRTGNLIVNGQLTLSGLGTDSRGYTMNGLYGAGRLSKGSSGTGLFRIGDNNYDGNFSGIIADGGTTAVEKIGTGTQIFTGANSWAGVTRILGGTLDVSTLANGALDSGIGRSTNVAANLVLNGGTLKYSGVATSTDRLFTVGALGGSLNASGSGAVNFTATGANVSAEAANRVGTRTTGSNVVTGVSNFADLVVGARVTGTGITAGTTITAINTTTGEVTLSANATANSSANLSFQTDRVLALSGSNTGANTITGVLANASSTGRLGVTKSGAGTWNLSGNNTYTGATNVTGGKLVISGGINSSTTLLAKDGTLELGAANVLANTASLTLDNGRLSALGFAETLGTLEIIGTNQLDLANVGNIINFDNSSSVTWASTLTISLWDGLSTGGGSDQVFFGSDSSGLTSDQLSKISFLNPTVDGNTLMGTYGAFMLSTGEIVVIPEPSASLLALLGGLALVARRKREVA